MDILTFRDYCLSLPMSEECMPFDDTTLVFKVGGRMYAYATIEPFERFAVKCDPEQAILLRENHSAITPAWHSNKRHWNDIYTTSDLPETLLREQISNSYMLVLRQNVTPRALREEILGYIEAESLHF